VNPWDDAQTLLDAYRQAAGAVGGGTISEGPVEWAPSVSSGNAGERSLDVGVVGAASPNSDMILYAGAGSNYSAFQEAIWGATDAPAVLSSSFAESVRATLGSPFYNAYQQLFIDAALRNISVFFAGGDTGSSATKPAGVPLINFAHSTPYATVVGGTSFSTLESAENDETLSKLVGLALAGDRATLRSLVAGGLTQMPSDGSALTRFVETVWNQYRYDAATQTIYSYTKNLAGSGGVDTTMPEPGYQQAFGIDAAGLGYGQTGRGDPDVSGLAGGNMLYITPHKDLTFDPADHGGTLGTSATSPLWAALTAQIQAVFADVGLPGTGYFNDLLYTAAAVSPGAFNDVTIGNNISTYVLGGTVTDGASGEKITPTGMGFRAAPGYDLTSGLGTPNGVLLTRSLLAIAEAQSYSDAAPMTDSAGRVSGATQILTVQPMPAAGFNGPVSVQISQGSTTTRIAAGSALAWTSQLAQQVLQPEFDGSLVRLFDGDAQATPFQISVNAAAGIGVSIGGASATPTGQELTTPYGFVDYAGDNGNSVELARPVAVAQTAGGADDQDAIVRIRQDGVDQLRLTFYRVDDYQGTIDGIAPGQAGYEQAALQRAYSTTDGSTSVSGPGYGNYAETSLTHVNAGDLIAMELANTTTQDMFWGFAGMNEIAGGAHVSHLWSYGLNTWGWEDTYGGGDQDYNDAVVQLDFTSGAGHQLVA
jgi:hypothetical protein